VAKDGEEDKAGQPAIKHAVQKKPSRPPPNANELQGREGNEQAAARRCDHPHGGQHAALMRVTGHCRGQRKERHSDDRIEGAKQHVSGDGEQQQWFLRAAPAGTSAPS
jgi:hypothetical protein